MPGHCTIGDLSGPLAGIEVVGDLPRGALGGQACGQRTAGTEVLVQVIPEGVGPVKRVVGRFLSPTPVSARGKAAG